MADEADAVAPVSTFVENLVFNKQNRERNSWNCCGSTIARSLAVYITVVFLVGAVIVTCLINLTLANSCEETTLWFSILCFVFGILIPIPSKQ